MSRPKSGVGDPVWHTEGHAQRRIGLAADAALAASALLLAPLGANAAPRRGTAEAGTARAGSTPCRLMRAAAARDERQITVPGHRRDDASDGDRDGVGRLGSGLQQCRWGPARADAARGADRTGVTPARTLHPNGTSCKRLARARFHLDLQAALAWAGRSEPPVSRTWSSDAQMGVGDVGWENMCKKVALCDEVVYGRTSEPGVGALPSSTLLVNQRLELPGPFSWQPIDHTLDAREPPDGAGPLRSCSFRGLWCSRCR